MILKAYFRFRKIKIYLRPFLFGKANFYITLFIHTHRANSKCQNNKHNNIAKCLHWPAVGSGATCSFCDRPFRSNFGCAVGGWDADGLREPIGVWFPSWYRALAQQHARGQLELASGEHKRWPEQLLWGWPGVLCAHAEHGWERCNLGGCGLWLAGHRCGVREGEKKLNRILKKLLVAKKKLQKFFDFFCLKNLEKRKKLEKN